LRREFDSKLTATRLADQLGVPCVPNVVGRVGSYDELHALAGHLGTSLVVQAAFGDSGETTWFVSSREDWDECAEQVVLQPEVKVMRRIRCRPTAIEACATRCGTVVGPLLTELVGFSELTPYSGGWAGNEVAPNAFSSSVRESARRYTQLLGDEMYRRGYRGYFEVDYLFNVNDESLVLGEINPRISGASSMTNLAAFAHADAPLFLFHLLEWSDADFELDVDDINQRWADPANMDPWANLLLKHTSDETHVVLDAPASGVWRLGESGIEYVRPQTHRRTVDQEDEAFFLRIATKGDVISEGDELGIIVVRGRTMDAEYKLSERGKAFVRAFRNLIKTQPVD